MADGVSVLVEQLVVAKLPTQQKANGRSVNFVEVVGLAEIQVLGRVVRPTDKRASDAVVDVEPAKGSCRHIADAECILARLRD